MQRVAAVLALALLAGCAQQVGLGYAPTAAGGGQASVMQGPPAIGAITVTDQRGEPDPTWIGAVRGGYGNPLKVLHTPHPLAEMVQRAFHDALAARGELAPGGNGPVDLAVTIVAFDSTQYIRREADVDFVVVLKDRATGREIYRDEVKANPVRGSLLAFDVGVFGSADDLQKVAQAAMSDAIDTAISKPGFTAALAGG